MQGYGPATQGDGSDLTPPQNLHQNRFYRNYSNERAEANPMQQHLASSNTRAAVQGDDSYPRMQDVPTVNQLYDPSSAGPMLGQQYPPGLSTDRDRSRSGSAPRAQAPPVPAPEPMQFQGQQVLQQPQPYVEFVPGSS